MAADFAAAGKVKVSGTIAKSLINRLATGEVRRESDLLSYLLFDGDFAAELIDMGRRDAAKKEDELASLFDVMSPAAVAVGK
jgi:NTE family protein